MSRHTLGQPLPPPPILTHARELLAGYDVLFCDVWGVVHDGSRAYPGAVDAMRRFRAKGGTIVLVSNAPVPQERVAAMLDYREVPRDAWDVIVSSGDIAIDHVARCGYRRVYAIGPQDRDAALFRALPAECVALEDAQAIVCTGLTDDINETEESYQQSYRPLLDTARQRKLPFVCANPDRVVDVGGRLYLCAGAVADLYERMGGPVFWAGKPHANAYQAAQAAAERLRSGRVDRRRILAIGDSVRTDLTGAMRAGIDALFVASGIHRDELMGDGLIHGQRLAELFPPGSAPAVAAMALLAW